MRYRLAASLVLLAGVALANGARFFGLSAAKAAQLSPLRCPLQALLGWVCPTCGLSRSLLALAMGSWRESWAYHPLGIPLAAFLVGAFLASWLAPQRLSLGARWLTSSRSVKRRLTLGGTVLLLGVFITRLASGHLASLQG